MISKYANYLEKAVNPNIHNFIYLYNIYNDFIFKNFILTFGLGYSTTTIN